MGMVTTTIIYDWDGPTDTPRLELRKTKSYSNKTSNWKRAAVVLLLLEVGCLIIGRYENR